MSAQIKLDLMNEDKDEIQQILLEKPPFEKILALMEQWEQVQPDSNEDIINLKVILLLNNNFL